MASLFCWKIVRDDRSHFYMIHIPKRAVIAIIVGAVCFGGLPFGSSPLATPVMGDVAQVPIAISSSVAKDPFSLWLDHLEEAESNRSGDSHLKILDNNGKYSYGCLQFQAATFIQYGKLYGLIPDGLTNVEPLIYSCSLQKELATDMIERNYLNWQKWHHSVSEVIGLPPRSEVSVADNR